VFIKYEAEVSSRVGGGERGVGDFGKLFTETNEQKFSLGGVPIAMVLCPMLWPCVRLCLSVSVTGRCSTKTAKHRITQTKPHDSSENLVI